MAGGASRDSPVGTAVTESRKKRSLSSQEREASLFAALLSSPCQPRVRTGHHCFLQERVKGEHKGRSLSSSLVPTPQGRLWLRMGPLHQASPDRAPCRGCGRLHAGWKEGMHVTFEGCPQALMKD